MVLLLLLTANAVPTSLQWGTRVCLRIGVQVLYNLFEWPMRKGSRLAVIGVANTMDLPQRLLPRIASRLGSRSPALPTCSCPTHMLLPYPHAHVLPTCSCPAHTLVLVLVLLTLSILYDTLRHAMNVVLRQLKQAWPGQAFGRLGIGLL